MIFYLLSPVLSYNLILIAAAVIPAIILMIHVYKADHLEKESRSMVWRLVKAGIFSTLIAMVLEKTFGSLLNNLFSGSSTMYRILMFFVVVGIAEEGAKYFELKLNTWNNVEFNCLYDGVLYAVFISMGFALWENINYVMTYGIPTALVRALTAIPGHGCFGVFMGVFYSAAKMYEIYGDMDKSRYCRILSVLVPVLIHGAYDYIATMNTGSNTNILFIVFILILFFVSYKLVTSVSRHDRYIR